MESFEPTLIAFVCNWCTYTAADLAGTSRLSYPRNVRLIRVMCTGMIHPELVMEGFYSGADGVIILGCHPGSCHYFEGNTKTQSRAAVLSDLLDDAGINPDRFELQWISSAEASVFARIITQFTNRTKQLGPLNYKNMTRQTPKT